jgi:2-polyprenyl-3-methyl-5-hydroxy-6-metoxy-1,4-benzoquinol methylase
MTGIDEKRAEAFGEKMVGILNGAATALMVSVGHRTGLFDVMSGLEGSTSSGIASEAGLDERYVREWLGAMVTGGIVEHDETQGTYVLPAEHAMSLTRESRPNNIAATCQWIPVLGSVEDEIVDCFERGGGVPYSSFERFHAVMAEESDQSVVAVLLDEILPGIPGVVEALERGIDVLDVGCGSGRALNVMAATYPRSRFTGYDFSSEGVNAGKAEAAANGLTNVHFEMRDVAELEVDDAFDLITAFDAIHDQARPDVVLQCISRALRGDGLFLMQDIAGSSHVHEDRNNAMAPFLYTISCMHCMTVSLASDGAGLGAMWGKDLACKMLAAAGFGDVLVTELPHDAMNYYYTARK